MHTRRDFLRNAAALSGEAFPEGSVPEAVARAKAIDPDEGTTFLDAEHVVILMQENRSFDHCFGALQGVRGFADPRPHRLPDGNPVWFQPDPGGQIFAPLRLDINKTQATWMGSLPHSWPDQVDARNGGRYDGWLRAKPSDHPGAEGMPLALGYYTRADIPFYYALADAFTVCDGHFCSSLTGTTANRVFFWTGKIREGADTLARVHNGDCDYEHEAAWTTFPERLEDAGVSWRIYQNELSLDSGLRGEEESWLSNFTNNAIEWFSPFRVRFAKGRRDYLARRAEALPDEIAALERDGMDASPKRNELRDIEAERAKYSSANWDALPATERALHEKAFSTNEGDPDYRALATIRYRQEEIEREVKVPKGDTLFRFRRDVENGELPAVSWLVAPENFSDHPIVPWYGAWYVSEALDILTKNPEVWKKTVFILTYDENDGYFDHVPPFVPPAPGRPETGKVSDGIDTASEWADRDGRVSPVGLGYRVPLVVASPWSRGGCVNSEVFDHTSLLRFLEVWLAHRGEPVRETEIGTWRRTVCGDFTSIFRPYNGEAIEFPKPLVRDAFVESIHRAKTKGLPTGFKGLTQEEIASADVGALQESGTRPSCPLAYELIVDATRKGDDLEVTFEARNGAFGDRTLGAPFNAYSYEGEMTVRAYAVKPGDALRDLWPVQNSYHVRIDGPNGFMREFRGARDEPPITIEVAYAGRKTPNGKLEIRISNPGPDARRAVVWHHALETVTHRKTVTGGGRAKIVVDTAERGGWYDFTVEIAGRAYRYAGRVETGRWSTTEPYKCYPCRSSGG